MAVNNVREAGRVAQQQQIPQELREAQRKLVELNTRENFERASTVSFDDGTDLNVRLLSAEQQASLDAVYASMPEGAAADCKKASLALASAALSSGGLSADGKVSSSLVEASSNAMLTYLVGSGAQTFSDASTGFMSMALSGLESQLGGFATDLKTNIGYANETRTSLTELQDMLSHWPEGAKQDFSYDEITMSKDGKATVTHKNVSLTKTDAQELVKKLESQLSSVNDITELKKFDLQKVYQDYQQAVQTLADIQKQTYDDAMKIIANAKA